MNNPMEIVKNLMGKGNSNPMIVSLVNMAKNGDSKSVENFARNLCKEQGRDFDKEFGEFMRQIKG